MNTIRRLKLWIAISILVAGYCSCTESTPMEITLQKAAKNKHEMERVLAYFSRLPEDSLKYKAAYFLIENMPDHVTRSSIEMRQYLLQINKELKNVTWDERLLARLLFLRFSDSSLKKLQSTEDIETLTSDFLIAHIESVFRQKDSCTWLQDIDFNDFCEFLLPYKLDTEEPILYRDSTVEGLQKMYDYIHSYDDTRISAVNLSKSLVSELWAYWPNIAKKLPPLEQYKSDCWDEAISWLLLHRLCGIPAAIDQTPCWGNYNGHHVWVQPIDHKTHYMGQVEKFNKSIPKVYRMTYSKQFEPNLEKIEEYVPPFFQDPYLKDVTNEYVNGISVKEIGFPENIHYGYLCVFNQGEWTPVSQAVNQSGKCFFPDMGPGIIYLPAFFRNEQLVPISFPFILKDNGEKIYQQITNEKAKMVLYRKYPMESRKGHYMKRIVESRIEASKSKHFRTYDTLCTILKNPVMQPIEFNLNQVYHFFRIIPGSDEGSPFAEIYFFNRYGKRIYGNMEGLTLNKEFLNDGDILTSSCVYEDLSFSLNPADTVASIRLLPHNDGNGIYPGNEYELFYFDSEQQWISCGKKTAETYRLNFEQVPQGGLFWLKNLTCGKEERIFTYRNGKQFFW